MTSHEEFVTVYSAEGRLAAESIKLLLESFNIPSILIQESAGAAYGLTVGSLGAVEIQVPADRVEEAQEILQAMEDGELENDAPEDVSNKADPAKIDGSEE